MQVDILIPYGLKDGELVKVNEVTNGLSCECTCPCCNEKLVAKNGGKKIIHHFAHYNSKQCVGAIESTVHLLAKDILKKGNRIKLPIIGYLYEVERNCYFEYNNVELEKRLGSIIPDVVLMDKKGTRLLVEIKVTHGVDETKREKLKDVNLPVIEIDLGFLHNTSEKQNETNKDNTYFDEVNKILEPLLLGDSTEGKYWVYLPITPKSIYDYIINNSFKLPTKLEDNINGIKPFNEVNPINFCDICNEVVKDENWYFCSANIDKKKLSSANEFLGILEITNSLPLRGININPEYSVVVKGTTINIPVLNHNNFEELIKAKKMQKKYIEEICKNEDLLSSEVIRMLQISLLLKQKAYFWHYYYYYDIKKLCYKFISDGFFKGTEIEKNYLDKIEKERLEGFEKERKENEEKINKFNEETYNIQHNKKLKNKIKRQVHNLDTIIMFKKYENKTVQWVLEKDKEYIIWLLKNIEYFKVSNEVLAILQKDI